MFWAVWNCLTMETFYPIDYNEWNAMKKILLLIYICFLTVLGNPGLPAANTMSRADSLLQAKKHFSFAVQYKNTGNFNLALEQYELSIAFNDTVYQVHYSLADLFMQMNRPVDAHREYLKTLTLNPSHFNSAAVLAKLYHEEAVYDSALVMYEIMYRLKPHEKKLLSSVAGLRKYLGKNADALDAYTTLIEDGDDTCDNLISASTLALSLEDFTRALRFSSLALTKCPEDISLLKIASHAALALGEYTSASLFLRQLAIADSTDCAVLEKLELSSRMQGDSGNFLWALERHHTLTPQDGNVIGELAELLFQEGNSERAVSITKKGLELSPQDGKLHILMGEYYYSLGEKENALEEYRRALQDERWKNDAQQLIWQLEPPETDEEKAEKKFFNRE